MNELPVKVHEEIKRLSAQGDSLAERDLYREAIASYNEAWQLVPEPRASWEASTWILAAIGDASFLGGFFKSGFEALEYAMHCPDGFGNPFLHLRFGQCALERNLPDLAADHLARAYMLEGTGIFSRENSKYFEFLKTKLKPPASGQW